MIDLEPMAEPPDDERPEVPSPEPPPDHPDSMDYDELAWAQEAADAAEARAIADAAELGW